ncbi:MAG: hypothetical protein OXC40_00205 [Proteobacteria bacterium]|nr:hypothetical protein [Pseudomonadota bacterium]
MAWARSLYAVIREDFLLLRKEKILLFFMLGLIVVTILARFVSEWSLDDPGIIFFNISHTALRFVGTFIALFFAIKILHDTKVSGNVETVLSRPVSKIVFLQGNFIALVATLLLYGAIFGVGWYLISLAFSMNMSAEFLFWGSLFAVSEWILMASVALFLASICGFGMAFLASYALWITGLVSGVLASSVENMSSTSTLTPVASQVAKIWSLDRFSLIAYSRDWVMPDGGFIFYAIAYSVVGTMALLLLSSVCFACKDVAS